VPPRAAVAPLLGWAGERKCNGRLVGREKDRERSLGKSRANQSQLGENSLIYYQSNQSRVIRNRTTSRKRLPPPLPSSRAQLRSPFLCLLPPSGAGGRGMGVAISSSHAVSAAPSSLRGGLLALFPCSSVGSLPRQTVFHELLQRGSPAGSPALPANLLRCGLLSPRGHKSCQEPAPARAPHGVTASLGYPPAPAWGLPQAVCRDLHPRGPPRLQGQPVSPWSARWLQGPSAPAPGAPPALLLHWAWALQSCSSHIISLLSLDAIPQIFFFPFLNLLSQRRSHHR